MYKSLQVEFGKIKAGIDIGEKTIQERQKQLNILTNIIQENTRLESQYTEKISNTPDYKNLIDELNKTKILNETKINDLKRIINEQEKEIIALKLINNEKNH